MKKFAKENINNSPSLHNLRSRKILPGSLLITDTTATVSNETILSESLLIIPTDTIATVSNAIAPVSTSTSDSTILNSYTPLPCDSSTSTAEDSSSLELINLETLNVSSDSDKESDSDCGNTCDLINKISLTSDDFLIGKTNRGCPKLNSMGYYYTKDYITKKGIK